MIGCDCAVCTSEDPRDRRTRASILVQANDHNILIDTTPELRVQCLSCNVTRVDAILYTHYHTDHVAGLDDLRIFNARQNTALTCYADGATIDVLKQMFPYAFEDRPHYPSEKPHLNLATIDGPFDLFGENIIPIPLFHGKMPVLGYRLGPFAYCTDCSRIPPESFELLKGLQVLVLDGLRRREHPTHFNLSQAVEIAQRISAGRTYLTHIAHELSHQATDAELPPSIALAYDGLVIECSKKAD